MSRSNTLHGRFLALLSKFESYGVVARPGSRLDQMARAFLRESGRVKDVVAPTDPDFRTALEAMRDLFLLEPILASLDAIELNADRRPLLKRLLKDPVVPRSTASVSRARDLQAELLAATRCVLGGFTDVALQEPPDVQATLDGVRWGIAVKRVKKANRIEQNMRDAADQVGRMGGPGVILLDVSLAFNENSTPLRAPSGEEFNESQARRLSDIIKNNEAAIFGRSKAKEVRLVYVFDTQIREVPEDGWGLATVTMEVDTFRDSKTDRQYKSFRKAFGLGIDRLSERH